MRRIFFIQPSLDGRIQFYNTNTTKSEIGTPGTKTTSSPISDDPARKTSSLQNLTDVFTVALDPEEYDKNVTLTESTRDKNNFTIIKISDENKVSQTLNLNATDTTTQSVPQYTPKYEKKSPLYDIKYSDDVGNEINEVHNNLGASHQDLKEAHKLQENVDKKKSKSAENNELLFTNEYNTEPKSSASNLPLVERVKDERNSTPVVRNETNNEEVRKNIALAVKNLLGSSSLISKSKDMLEQLSGVKEGIPYYGSGENRSINLPREADRISVNETRAAMANASTHHEKIGFISNFENFIRSFLEALMHSSKDQPKALDISVNKSPDHSKASEKSAQNELRKMLNESKSFYITYTYGNGLKQSL